MKCLLIALTVLTLFAVGCGGSDASAADEDRVRPVETSSTSTSSSTSTATSTSSTTTIDVPASTTTSTLSSVAVSSTQHNTPRPTAPPGTGYVDEGASPELEAELIGIVSEVRELATRAALTLKLANSSLDRLMTPPLAQRYREMVRDWRQSGEIGRLPDNSVSGSSFGLIFVDGDLAVLQECVTDDIIVTIAETDEVVDDSVGRRINEWTLRRTSNGWKASAQTTVLSGQDAMESDRCDFS